MLEELPLLNIDLPFKFIKPDTEDKDYFVTYLQKLNELKSIYGTFPKMIMSRGTFIKKELSVLANLEISSKCSLQAMKCICLPGLSPRNWLLPFLQVIYSAIEIKEDYVVDQTGKNIPIYADGRISLLPQDKKSAICASTLLMKLWMVYRDVITLRQMAIC